MSRLGQRILLFFGERLALVVLVLILGISFIAGTPTIAYSEEEQVQFKTQGDEWYEEIKVNPQVPQGIKPLSYSVGLVTVTPSPTPIPAPTEAPMSEDIWDRLAECESHRNWSINTGNGYYGGLQFSEGSWHSVGGSGLASDASREEQIMRGKALQAVRGWGAWGDCAKKLNLN